jgi:hypothetical protein
MYSCCPEMPEIERTLRTGYPYPVDEYDEEDEDAYDELAWLY